MWLFWGWLKELDLVDELFVALMLKIEAAVFFPGPGQHRGCYYYAGASISPRLIIS
jgi:hypothetical protein